MFASAPLVIRTKFFCKTSWNRSMGTSVGQPSVQDVPWAAYEEVVFRVFNTAHNAHNSVVALSFPFLTDALIREESQPNPNLWSSVPQCTFQTPCNQVAPSSKSCSQLGSSCDKCAVVPTGGRVSPGKKHPKRARWAAEFPRLADGQIRSFCSRLQVSGLPQSCEAAK